MKKERKTEVRPTRQILRPCYKATGIRICGVGAKADTWTIGTDKESVGPRV